MWMTISPTPQREFLLPLESKGSGPVPPPPHPPDSRTVRDNPQNSKVYSGDYTPGVKYPPQPPKAGNEWVWSPEGYWAERNIVEPFHSRGRPKHPALWGRISSGPKYINSSPTTASGTVGRAPEEASYMSEILIAAEQDYGNAHDIPALSECDSSSIRNAQNSKQQIRGLSYISPTYPQFLSPSGEPEGLYCRAKRGIEEGLMKKREKVCHRCLIFRINCL
jgi:parafibromin